MPADRSPAAAAVPAEKVERAKKWALMKFREILRGARCTEQIQRWLSGELDPEGYRFQLELALDDKTKKFIEDPKNIEMLNKENLV